MNENIEKCNSNKTQINFLPKKENEINEFLEKIKIFGKLEVLNDYLSFEFKEGKKLYFK